MTNTSIIDKSGLVEQVLKQLHTKLSFNEKSLRIIRLISEAYLPSRCTFVPQILPQFRTKFSSTITEYGPNNDLILSDSDSLITLTKKLGNPNDSYSVGLTSDIKDDSLRQVVMDHNISSFLIISLLANQHSIGYIALYEDSVTRLWAKEDLDNLISIAQVCSSYFHSQLLQNEINAQETVLQKAIESSNDGYWHIDLVQNKMHFSRQWKRMLGFDKNELTESFSTFEELIHPDDKEVVLQVLDPYLKIGVGAYECEYRIKTKKGKFIWVLTRAHVNYSENGVPQQFVATNTDITTRIEYKNKIAQSEAKYEKLVGSIHEIIFEIDHNGIFTFLNEAWERHLLLKVSKTIGTNSLSYIHPNHRAFGESIINTKYSGQLIVRKTIELKFIAANGKSVWMESHSSIQFGSDHELIGVSGTLINIDDKKKTQLAQQASENKIARISDNITDIITELDEKGNYLFISNGVRNMLGRNPLSFNNTNLIYDIHPEDRELIKTNVIGQLKNGAKKVVEQYRVRTGSDTYTWIESIVQPLISASGQKTFIATSRDISARRKLQEETQASLQKEKDLNDLKSRFITMTSHEFRTPLSSIKSSVELLEMYAEDLGDRFMNPFHRHFEKITSQVGRISSLLNNIDTLGKIEAMDMPFNPEKQNLVEFISNSIKDQTSNEFAERTVDLKVIGESRIVVFDGSLLDNMICNILKNALLYSNDTTPVLTIEFIEGKVVITIKDQGLGIPESEMSHLFTSFFRAQNIVNLNIPGNGLGLVIAKKIVDLHDGDISIKSQENEGTEVIISLPDLVIE